MHSYSYTRFISLFMQYVLVCVCVLVCVFLCVCVFHAVQVSCGFESTDSIVQETVGSVEVCVGVPSSQVLQFQFSLTITTVDGSASELVCSVNIHHYQATFILRAPPNLLCEF